MIIRKRIKSEMKTIAVKDAKYLNEFRIEILFNAKKKGLLILKRF